MKQACKKLLIYIDGASHGNPGPSGIGVIIGDEEGNTLGNISKFIGNATNNIAEYTALIYSLQEALILRADEVIIKTDSELLAKQLNGEYKVRDAGLKPLYEQVLHLSGGFRKFEIRHIDRSDNKDADRLADKAIKKESLF
ncbi:MAG: ribonuclease HI family protein [Candidatus Omnitrophota bacterium]